MTQRRRGKQPGNARKSNDDEFVQFPADNVERSIAACFERQARRWPQRLAVKTSDTSLTYDALNRAANRVARAIVADRRQGAEPIALLFKTGAALIVADFAALKAGKPFVPLDPALPLDKLRQILRDFDPRLILTDAHNFALAQELTGDFASALNIDELDSRLSDEDLALPIAPDSVAYIHYTSGSTGEPKGVVANQRSEIHNIMTNTQGLRITPADRVSLVRSNNVGATRDILLALLNGAALFPLDLHEGLADLADWLRDQEITVFTCVASVFRHAVDKLRDDVPNGQRFPKVRIIHVGGEAIAKSDVELFKKHFSDDCLFVTRLGLSETETLTYYFIDKQTEIDDERVPVGYPLEGNEILLLDDDGRELGVNQVGEIAVKSEYLALGYWRRPELTREKFLADPNGGRARIYLTGDLGYRRADGCLVHVGRKDFQTKIRGHRVELSEVEMALREIAGVKQAVALAQGESTAGARLVAYVVAHDGQELTARALRAALQKKLPSYMVPGAFVFLDRLPLTAAGKIDRRALPAPQRGRAQLNTPFNAPQSALERVLAQLWCEILDLDELGSDDEFGELGGDSLLAAQVVARVNDWFSLAPPLKTLFETPTVASLAAYLSSRDNAPDEAQRIAVAILKVTDMSPEEIAEALARDGHQQDDG